MEDRIIDWLKQKAVIDDTVGFAEYQDADSESFSSAAFYDNNIGEVNIKDIVSVEVYPAMVFKGPDSINEKIVLNGCGCFTLKNGDYFKGEFHGSIANREGTFVRLSNAGSTVEGTWSNGKAEVLSISIPIFFKG